MKHTPGPWSYWNGICSPGGRVTQDETGTHIAIPTVYANAQLTDANARLIAAAPELLEALKSVLDMVSSGKTSLGLVEYARSAIAKATGEDL